MRSSKALWDAILPVLLASAAIASTGAALAGEPLPDRQGFGYTIQFTSGPDATPLLPVPAPQAMIDRPTFGYTINFLPGDPADQLFPPGWAAQRAASQRPEG
jgi:hypothetical protein